MGVPAAFSCARSFGDAVGTAAVEGVVLLAAKTLGDGLHASGHESRYADIQLLELEIAALERDCAENSTEII